MLLVANWDSRVYSKLELLKTLFQILEQTILGVCMPGMKKKGKMGYSKVESQMKLVRSSPRGLRILGTSTEQMKKDNSKVCSTLGLLLRGQAKYTLATRKDSNMVGSILVSTQERTTLLMRSKGVCIQVMKTLPNLKYQSWKGPHMRDSNWDIHTGEKKWDNLDKHKAENWNLESWRS
jgi:hypothetical protein